MIIIHSLIPFSRMTQDVTYVHIPFNRDLCSLSDIMFSRNNLVLLFFNTTLRVCAFDYPSLPKQAIVCLWQFCHAKKLWTTTVSCHGILSAFVYVKYKATSPGIIYFYICSENNYLYIAYMERAPVWESGSVWVSC